MNEQLYGGKTWIDRDNPLYFIDQPLSKEDELINKSKEVGTLGTEASPHYEYNQHLLGTTTHTQSPVTEQIGSSVQSKHSVDDVPDTMDELDELLRIIEKSGKQLG